MIEGLNAHFVKWGVLYVILIVFSIFGLIMMFLWRFIVTRARNVSCTIYMDSGDKVMVGVLPGDKKFSHQGKTYLINRIAIRSMKRFFGTMQFLNYFENIPEPFIITKLIGNQLTVQFMQGDVLSEILDHKWIKEISEVNDKKDMGMTSVYIVGAIVLFIVVVVVAYTMMKPAGA